MNDHNPRGSWSSRTTFVLAAVGAAVGLGNIWKFPYMAGENGGGAFVAVYLAAVVLIAIPILIGELAVGRRGGMSPPRSLAAVAAESSRSSLWAWVGWLSMLASYLILTYYTVVAGWTLAYAFKAATGELLGISGERALATFDRLLASPWRLVFWHAVITMLSVGVVSMGLKNGIERAVNVLMPALFVALASIVAYAVLAGDVGAAAQFLFSFDFSKVDGAVVLSAVGQAFFSISVAMGMMMAYGAYLPKDVSIVRVSFVIAGADTFVAILGGLAVFPLVFANGLDPAEGPGLVFVTLPLALGAMPAGSLIGALFFVLLVIAALMTAIAVLEPIVAWAEDRGVARSRSAVAAGALSFAIGISTVLSFNHWSAFYPLDAIPGFAGRTFFAATDYLTANVMIPLAGLLLSVFVGWKFRSAHLSEELQMSKRHFSVWLWIIRFVVPVCLCAVAYASLGG